MAFYLIGDVQGCHAALQRLLNEISFSPSQDTLFLLGDLVNRGPDSAGVVRRLMGYGAAAQCLLGNHDLHLLAVAHGVREPHRKDTVGDILAAPDREAMLGWLRWQHMALLQDVGDERVLMVHAGVLPSWSATQTMTLAAEVETVLRGPGLGDFLHEMYGDEPNAWADDLVGTARLRVIVNTLTRLRFCDAQGRMDFNGKSGLDSAPHGYMPWFDVPGRLSADTPVAFGHWSTLGWLGRPDVLALDTGCVWGGCLSALRLEAGLGGAGMSRQLIQVPCEQAQTPGR